MSTDVLALREARERLGLTLREAAPRLGIDFTYLSKVENGHERPSDALLLRMCDLYGLEPDAVVLARAVAEVPARVRDALIAAVRAETLAGAGVVEALRDIATELDAHWEHGEECGVWATDDETDEMLYPGDLPGRHEACDCGIARLLRQADAALAATPPTPALTAARLADAMREQHRPVPYHWSQSGESGTVCAGSIVGLHHRVERWPCDVESAILAALAATPPAPAVERCGYLIRMLGLTPFICNRAEDDALHRSRTHPDAHSFLTATHTPERLLDAIEAQAIGEVEA